MSVAKRRCGVKKLIIALVLLLLAGAVTAATLVLKGGKRLDVQGFAQQGNLMVVTLANGKVQSYPLAAIDAAATREANPVAAAPAPAKPAGPQSPFAAAKAGQGEGTLVVTDSDVLHAAVSEGGEDAGTAGDKENVDKGPAKVELVSYQKRPVGENEWELGVVIENAGGADAGGVVVTAHATGTDGNSLGSGTGSVAGKLEPGKQATVTIKMPAFGAANAFRFDISYQSIKTVPPAQAPGAAGAAAQGGEAATPAAQATPRVTRVQAPPNTMTAPNQAPMNPNAQAPLTVPPTPPPSS